MGRETARSVIGSTLLCVVLAAACACFCDLSHLAAQVRPPFRDKSAAQLARLARQRGHATPPC